MECYTSDPAFPLTCRPYGLFSTLLCPHHKQNSKTKNAKSSQSLLIETIYATILFGDLMDYVPKEEMRGSDSKLTRADEDPPHSQLKANILTRLTG